VEETTNANRKKIVADIINLPRSPNKSRDYGSRWESYLPHEKVMRARCFSTENIGKRAKYNELKDFMKITEGKSGKAERQKKMKNTHYKLARTSYIHTNVDKGFTGIMEGFRVVAELVSFPLLPVIIPMRAIELSLWYLSSIAWVNVQYCANKDKLSSSSSSLPMVTLVSPLEDDPTLEMCSARRHDSAWGSFDFNVAPVPSQSRETNCTKLAVIASDATMNFFHEDSLYSRLTRMLNYRRYTAVNKFIIRWWVYLKIPLSLPWVVYRAPEMYLMYYFGGWHQLPQLRSACLIREAISVAYSQMENLLAEMKDIEKKDLHMKALEKGSTGRALSSPAETVMGEWAAVEGDCAKITTRGYDYKVCLFGQIWQGDILIGQFLRWGTLKDGLLYPEMNSQKRPTSLLSFAWHIGAEVMDFLGFGPAPSINYASQVYVGGSSCSSVPRSAQINFDCSDTFSLDSVEEPLPCQYLFTVSTPLACSTELEAAALERIGALGKDEVRI
jgi:hypothetical protein